MSANKDHSSQSPSACNAVVVTPGKADSARVQTVNIPQQEQDALLLRVLRVGICGTDAEICRGLYGKPPDGHEELVLGHESLVRVERATPGGKWAKGQLGVVIVRRPCPEGCPPCSHGRWDYCQTGHFHERGINGLDGFMSEFVVESPDYFVPVPDALESVGVLIEPLSIVEKAVEEAIAWYGRTGAPPQRGLVTGAGPIGLLAALVLRARGLDVWVVDRLPNRSLKAELVDAVGGHYLDDHQSPFEHRIPDDGIDIAIEATGAAPLLFRALNRLGANGVLALTGVTGGHHTVSIDGDVMNTQTVLENHTMLGSVNAARTHYEAAIRDLADWQSRWGSLTEKMITGRFPLQEFSRALTKGPEDIKSVVEVLPA